MDADDTPPEVAEAPAPVKATPRILICSGQVTRIPEWEAQLSQYLQDYQLEHVWLTGHQPPDYDSAPIKGVVFLLEPAESLNESLYQDVQRRNLPFIKHYLSNITRLKIDILDAFIR
jgi:hypothetical protein